MLPLRSPRPVRTVGPVRPVGPIRPRLGAHALSAALVLGVSVGACSLFDPNVGAFVNDGSTAPACSVGASGYGTTYGSPTGQAATTDFCTADGGTIEGPCDTCEATSCCAERIACYSEQACSCADSALDACTAAVPDASATNALLACWTAFSATNATAQARFACLAKSCTAACEIPNGG